MDIMLLLDAVAAGMGPFGLAVRQLVELPAWFRFSVEVLVFIALAYRFYRKKSNPKA